MNKVFYNPSIAAIQCKQVYGLPLLCAEVDGAEVFACIKGYTLVEDDMCEGMCDIF